MTPIIVNFTLKQTLTLTLTNTIPVEQADRTPHEPTYF